MVEVLRTSVMNKTWAHMPHGKIRQLQSKHWDNFKEMKSQIVDVGATPELPAFSFKELPTKTQGKQQNR